MSREDRFYWTAVALGEAPFAAFLFGVHDSWLLLPATVLSAYGLAHGTLKQITANKDGVGAEWQVQAIREKLRASGAESLAVTDSAEAVTRGGSIAADAVLSPAEFVKVLDAVSARAPTATGTRTANDATSETDPDSR